MAKVPMEEFVDTSQATVFTPSILTSSNDLNNVKTIGFYAWGSSRPSNCPTSDAGSMIVLQRGYSGITQIVYDITKIYTRIYISGAWQLWNTFDHV